MILSKTSSPNFREKISASQPSELTLELLLKRRSLTVKDFINPGASPDQLDQILTIASRVPDHKKQVPWRFIIIEGEARAKMGNVLQDEFLKNEPDTSDACLLFEQNRFMRSPVIIGVISKADPLNDKTPEWEQILTAGAVCQNILIAANAMGCVAQWFTEWYAYDRQVLSAMGLDKIERIAGFIYISTGESSLVSGRDLI